MPRYLRNLLPSLLAVIVLLLVLAVVVHAAKEGVHEPLTSFPPDLNSYHDAGLQSLTAILKHRIAQVPFNLVASLIFLCAILHTFLAGKFTAVAERWEKEHHEKIHRGEVGKNTVHMGAGLFHFLGEVETVFGIWAVVLAGAVCYFYDWNTLVDYINHKVDFSEAMFVVAIMILASTRPILYLSENCMRFVANLLGGSLAAWWITMLTIGPLLSSFITEPAAMTITALLLAHKFYDLKPKNSFKYATIGLLFVNVSIGGTLTHFAAPPVLMVAEVWGWNTPYMLTHFGWISVLSIMISNFLYFLIFRREFTRLQQEYQKKKIKDELQHKFLSHSRIDEEIDRILLDINYDKEVISSLRQQIEKKVIEVKAGLAQHLKERYMDELVAMEFDPHLVKQAFDERFEEVKIMRMRKAFPRLLPEEMRPDYIDPQWDRRDDPVPAWVVLFHVAFMLWIIVNAHHPAMFIAGLLFFLGFARVTTPYQNTLDLKAPLLVGFFLAGLVIHGGLQAWWIAPVLGSLGRFSLMLTAIVLTAFNDNAAITFLSTLVPHFSEALKHAVVAGAVTGGGLTVIANAPNPAGQSLLKKYFDNGISPFGLFKAALIPTIIVFTMFFIFL